MRAKYAPIAVGLAVGAGLAALLGAVAGMVSVWLAAGMAFGVVFMAAAQHFAKSDKSQAEQSGGFERKESLWHY